MHSHEDLLTAFSLSADLPLRSRLYAFAERKVLLKRNTLGEAVNWRSPKNAFSEAASIFGLRQLLRGLKGASSPFLATATTAACGGNREELLGPRSAGHECRPRHKVDAGYRNPSDPARRNRWWFSGSLLTSKENLAQRNSALYLYYTPNPPDFYDQVPKASIFRPSATLQGRASVLYFL